MQLRERAIEDGRCGTCGQEIDAITGAALRATLPAAVDTTPGNAARALMELDLFKGRDVSGVVTQLTRRLAKARGEAALLKDEIKDKATELADADVDRLEGDSVNLGETMRKIVITEKALEDHRQKVEEADASIQNLKGKLAKLAPADLRASQVRSTLLREAKEVFQAAVEGYKAELRARVQETATDLFLRMTTERSEYAGLEITPTYGLNLIHRDSAVEEGRSAGAEHVIALALMGALQRNAPLKGPIVMDSPFGRLDDEHTHNVVATLPTMASQVVLLVHAAELRQSRVREILGNKLLREYQLVRESSRRTRIDLVR